MLRKFVIYCLIFFLPVVLAYLWVEKLVVAIPSAYPMLQEQLETQSETIETLILGSSQMMSGINAEWLESPTLNLASGSQHHDTDFRLLQGLIPKLPRLKTVVLEVSYSHFELPHNGPEFWKNSLYRKYYGVNCFERPSYFKDQLLYLSNPKVFSEQINEYYFQKKAPFEFNSFGFNYADTYGQFSALQHNKAQIDTMRTFKINLIPNETLFHQNKAYFLEMLAFLEAHNLRVIICTVPMYPTYLEKRVPEIVHRRDEVLTEVTQRHPNVLLLDLEESGTHYAIQDFWNQSHLSPSGAKKFTEQLNQVLLAIPSSD